MICMGCNRGDVNPMRHGETDLLENCTRLYPSPSGDNTRDPCIDYTKCALCPLCFGSSRAVAAAASLCLCCSKLWLKLSCLQVHLVHDRGAVSDVRDRHSILQGAQGGSMLTCSLMCAQFDSSICVQVSRIVSGTPEARLACIGLCVCLRLMHCLHRTVYDSAFGVVQASTALQ